MIYIFIPVMMFAIFIGIYVISDNSKRANKAKFKSAIYRDFISSHAGLPTMLLSIV